MSENSPGAVASSETEPSPYKLVQIADPCDGWLFRAEIKMSDGFVMDLKLDEDATPRAFAQFYRMAATALKECLGVNNKALADAFAEILDAVRTAQQARQTKVPA